jgi:hypothetical protein
VLRLRLHRAMTMTTLGDLDITSVLLLAQGQRFHHPGNLRLVGHKRLGNGDRFESPAQSIHPAHEAQRNIIAAADLRGFGQPHLEAGIDLVHSIGAEQL